MGLRLLLKIMARLVARYLVGIGCLIASSSLFLYLVLRSSPKVIHEGHRTDLWRGLFRAISCTGYPPSYTRPWFRPMDEYTGKQLVFFGKPIMHALKVVSLDRQWTVKLILNDSAVGTTRLHASLSSRKFTVLFTSSKSLRKPHIAQYVNHSNILVAAIPNIYKFTGAKKEQYKAYQRVLNKYGCSIEDTRIMPRSYLLDNRVRCLSFFKQTDLSSKMWVLKTSRGYGGDGITIYSNVTKLREKFGACSHNREVIAQEYIQNLLLVEGRKFDIRALILVGGTQPYTLFHHEGYLRVSVRKFDPLGGREVHLTNSHVQTSSNKFQAKNHFWTYPQFQEYLDQHYPNNDNFVSRRLLPFIKKMSILIIQSSLNNPVRCLSCFQFLGLDFMVSGSDWKVWFIESNNYPLWPRGTPEINKLIETAGHDMFDLVIGMRQNPAQYISQPIGTWFNSWQLFWRETTQECPQYYNPCTDLTT